MTSPFAPARSSSDLSETPSNVTRPSVHGVSVLTTDIFMASSAPRSNTSLPSWLLAPIAPEMVRMAGASTASLGPAPRNRSANAPNANFRICMDLPPMWHALSSNGARAQIAPALTSRPLIAARKFRIRMEPHTSVWVGPHADGVPDHPWAQSTGTPRFCDEGAAMQTGPRLAGFGKGDVNHGNCSGDRRRCTGALPGCDDAETRGL